MDLICQIQQQMCKQGLTVYKLAQLTGVPRSTLGDLFKHHNSKLDVLVKVCTALQLEIIAKPINKHK